MSIPGPLRSALALCLLALLGALGTGLPSHSHAPETRADSERPLLRADHHAHGTHLIEQDDRAPSAGPQVATVAATGADIAPAPIASLAAPLTDPLRPTERAPPPGAPRAPPTAV